MLSRFVQRHSYTDTCITAGVPNCHQPADENTKRVRLLPQTLNIYTLKKYLNPGTHTCVELLFFSMFPAEFKYGITLLFSSQVVCCFQSSSTLAVSGMQMLLILWKSLCLRWHRSVQERLVCLKWSSRGLPGQTADSVSSILYSLFLFSVYSVLLEKLRKTHTKIMTTSTLLLKPQMMQPVGSIYCLKATKGSYWSLSTSYFGSPLPQFNYWPSPA